MKTTRRVSHLREERVNGKPVSLSKMDLWLKARKVHLGDYMKDMEEKAVVDGILGAAMVEDDNEDNQLEMGGEQCLAMSEDEEVYTDGDEDNE